MDNLLARPLDNGRFILVLLIGSLHPSALDVISIDLLFPDHLFHQLDTFLSGCNEGFRVCLHDGNALRFAQIGT